MVPLQHMIGAGVLAVATLVGLTTTGCTQPSAHDGISEETGGSPGVVEWLRRQVAGLEPYALDDVSREVTDGEQASCDRESLVRHEGETVRWHGVLNVHPAFVERLERFETVAHEVGLEIYGRPPRRIEHAGAFACRPIRGSTTRLSEHALGNAVDVVGFRFGPHPRSDEEKARVDIPPRLHRPFSITIERHWQAEDDNHAIHERFLRTLAERLAEEGVFRGMIGPSRPGHANHLHFDMGRYVYRPL